MQVLSRFDRRVLFESEHETFRDTVVAAAAAKANLSGADLFRADLSSTVLDPAAEPNGCIDGFAADGDYVIGYRTRAAGHIDQYRDGRVYAADWFSVCQTECHPGLYLWPTLEDASRYSGDVRFIAVKTRPADVHKAGTKWRCRWFEVIGAADQEK